MIEQERTITYHTVTLGEMTRDGDTLAEIIEQCEADEYSRGEGSSGGKEGSAVTARDEDGDLPTLPVLRKRTLRVPAGLPAERVTIAVEAPAQPPAGKRKRRWKPRPPRVWITEIHEASPLRAPAPCPVFGTCGGCQLQHMQYSAQLAWKRSVVQQLLHDIAGFADPPVLEVVPCDEPWHYRNHMRFSVNREGQAGLTARGTHRVLPLRACPIAHPRINDALDVLADEHLPQPQALIRYAEATEQMLLQPAQSQEARERLRERGLDLRDGEMEEGLGGVLFRIRPSSFFQTNTHQ